MEAWQDYEQDNEETDRPEYDIRLEALIPVLKRELIVKMHAHRADDILTAIRLAREFNLRYTIDHCTEGHLIAELLKEQSVSVILGPLLTDRSKTELRNQNIEAPGIMTKQEIPVAIMTDHPCVPQQYLLLCAAVRWKDAGGGCLAGDNHQCSQGRWHGELWAVRRLRMLTSSCSADTPLITGLK